MVIPVSFCILCVCTLKSHYHKSAFHGEGYQHVDDALCRKLSKLLPVDTPHWGVEPMTRYDG